MARSVALACIGRVMPDRPIRLDAVTKDRREDETRCRLANIVKHKAIKDKNMSKEAWLGSKLGRGEKEGNK